MEVLSHCHRSQVYVHTYVNTLFHIQFIIYSSNIEPCRGIVLQLAAVLLMAKVIAYMTDEHYVQNKHKLLSVIKVIGMVPW